MKLSKQAAIDIALTYQSKYIPSSLGYQVVNVQFFPETNHFNSTPVWEIAFDVYGWDDIWYSIIVSDTSANVICCSNMWTQIYYPHIQNETKKIKSTPWEKRLRRKNT